MIEPLMTGELERRMDRFYGKYRGTVAVNVDPLGQGRLKAFVPEVLGEIMSGFAFPAAPYAGTAAGFFAVPPIGAGVWIEFEAGDTSRPIWTGAWWGSGEAPPDETGTPPQQTNKILRTEFGLLISLDDLAQTITICDGAGLSLMRIKVLEGKIEVKSPLLVVLDAPLIKHGEGATHPAVFGDQLLTYLNQLVAMFNSHVHPGELAAGFIPVTPAPPVPFFPPATPARISSKVVVE
jgi:hypothetical protein